MDGIMDMGFFLARFSDFSSLQFSGIIEEIYRSLCFIPPSQSFFLPSFCFHGYLFS